MHFWLVPLVARLDRQKRIMPNPEKPGQKSDVAIMAACEFTQYIQVWQLIGWSQLRSRFEGLMQLLAEDSWGTTSPSSSASEADEVSVLELEAAGSQEHHKHLIAKT